jgi:ATP-dependent Clp protease protease subunit
MKYIVAALLGLVASQAFGAETILLEKKNTVSLREEFTQSSVDTVKQALIALDHTLPSNEFINLYLNTPGGDVVAGNSLNDVIKGLKHKVNVIVEFAASMGYITTQATTGKRYITNSGVLMAHRAYVGVQGQTPGEVNVRLAFYEDMTNRLAAMAASRTGVTTQQYQNKVVKEYWVEGDAAIKDKQADEVVNVQCAANLKGTSGETIYTFFGPIEVEWDNCPLISSPVSINIPRNELGYSELEYQNFNRSVQDMLTKSKFDIVDDKSLIDNYHRYVR